MDKVAQAVGLTPEEFRRRNLLRTGDTTATGQIITQRMDLAALQRKALSEAGYDEKIARFAKENLGSTRKRGIGFATFFHGAGFTGSGERYLQSVIELELSAEGKICVSASMTEMGQGTNTVLTQVAAEALGADYDAIQIKRPDTAAVPNSGPTVASRTSMVIGRLVERAAHELKSKLESAGYLPAIYTPDELEVAAARYATEQGPVTIRTQYEEPPGIYWDDQTYRGDAYGAYSWATYVASVTVDTLTGEVTVDDFVAAQEVGRVLNPVLAEGQIEGGVVQGIGLALYEKVVWKNGGMMNNQMTNYIIPTAMDIPFIRVLFDEIPYEHGAMGAKGIGELPIDGPAPAILNAVENAIGIGFSHVPLLPEDVLQALEERREVAVA
jgi:CO/xanthine dehydrogenase Mo-binding subunit